MRRMRNFRSAPLFHINLSRNVCRHLRTLHCASARSTQFLPRQLRLRIKIQREAPIGPRSCVQNAGWHSAQRSAQLIVRDIATRDSYIVVCAVSRRMRKQMQRISQRIMRCLERHDALGQCSHPTGVSEV